MTNFSSRMCQRILLPFLLIFVLFPGVALAVPDKVEDSFEDRYEDAVEVEWEVDSNGYWEAKFQENGEKYRADFTKEGEWIETERSLKFDEMPDPVQSAVRSEHGDREIAELEEVDSAAKGLFYDVEFKEKGKNEDFEYNKDGEPLGSFIVGFNQPLPDIGEGTSKLGEMTLGTMLMEFLVNLVSIIIYAYFIYYLRHHNHKMMFLLLAFNLFLFPIFLLSSVLTMGFGFTIFALLALVRLRSENFDKAEVAYLLGAVALTFINSQLSANIEIVATAIVLVTAFIADHPKLWRSAYQTTEIHYKISGKENMLDREHLRRVISEDYNIDVSSVEIKRVAKKEVRLTVIYSDSETEPSLRKKLNKKGKVEPVSPVQEKTATT